MSTINILARTFLSHLRCHHLGHYRALEWSEKEQAYKVNEELGILVQVTVSNTRLGRMTSI